jgi:hypothetical protein
VGDASWYVLLRCTAGTGRFSGTELQKALTTGAAMDAMVRYLVVRKWLVLASSLYSITKQLRKLVR